MCPQKIGLPSAYAFAPALMPRPDSLARVVEGNNAVLCAIATLFAVLCIYVVIVEDFRVPDHHVSGTLSTIVPSL